MKNNVLNYFKESFKKEPDEYIRCGGRFEILGNHTDHNHGKCIAATCDMSIYSAVSKRDDKLINIESKGYPTISLSLDNLEVNENEKGTSNALVRGVAQYLNSLGYSIGGFDAAFISTIFPGAGVSSSAAYELLIGEIFSHLFNESKIEKIVLAKAGQYAENKYYGKSCGLLDQIGVSFGGFVTIDFKNIDKPEVKNINMELKDHSFILVNTGGDHAKMSPLYSKIPADMKEVAKELGVSYLIESNKDALNQIMDSIDENKYLRACHFFDENKRVESAIEAISNQDINTLKNCINASRISCHYQLKNMMADDYEGSPLEACDLVDKLTNGEGAAKINGGGFAGSIVTLIPDKYKESFIEEMSKKYGIDNVYQVEIDKIGSGNY